MTEQLLEVRASTLNNLLVEVESGRYRVPHFQREYVWERSKVVQLLDSIYHGFPIGSIFLWKAGRDANGLFRNVDGLGLPHKEPDDGVSFILDGQQRVTSLYLALKGRTFRSVDYAQIVFDLDEERFTHKRGSLSDRFVSVARVWEGSLASLYRSLDEERGKRLERLQTRLRTYPISLVEVREKTLPEVCEIFQRINQAGKSLNRFDLVAAATFSPEFDLRKRFEEDIVAPLASKGFGGVPPTVVTQLLALLTSGSCTETHEFSLTAQDVQEHWPAVVKSVLKTCDTLRQSFGVFHAYVVPYAAQITLPSYFFARADSATMTQAQHEWIEHWFWRSTFGQRYSSATASTMSRDRVLFEALAKHEMPEQIEPPQLRATDLVSTLMRSATSALRNGFLNVLAVQPAKDLATGANIDMSTPNLSEYRGREKHHIFPFAYLRSRGHTASDIHRLPNFCFLTSELNKRVGARPPTEYFQELRQGNAALNDALTANLLPTYERLIEIGDDYPAFLKERVEIILDEIQRRCGGLAAAREQDRHSVIAALEVALRQKIDEALKGEFGPNWWVQAVPGPVRVRAAEIYRRSEKKPADENTDLGAAGLANLNFGDLKSIMLYGKAWPAFQDEFKAKDKVTQYLDVLSDFRNRVMHHRAIDDVLAAESNAAVKYFQSILELDFGSESEHGEASSLDGFSPSIRTVAGWALDISSDLRAHAAESYVGIRRSLAHSSFVRIAKRKTGMRIAMRFPLDENWMRTLKSCGIEVIDYNARKEMMRIRLYHEQVAMHESTIRDVLRAAFHYELERRGVASEKSSNDRNLAYQAFFQSLIDCLRDEHAFTNAKQARPNNWYSFASGMSGFQYVVSFTGDGRVRAELYIDTEDGRRNKEILAILSEHRTEIESELGPLSWEPLNHRRASRIASYTPGSIDEPNRVPELLEWSVSRMLEIRRVLGPRLMALSTGSEAVAS